MTKTITPKTNCSAEQFLEQCAARVVRELEQSIAAHQDKPLTEVIRYASFDGGKRVRPGLIYATAAALDIDYEKVDAIACAVELIHCYSLVHDDLPAMDDDAIRRGKPSCHKAFGEAEAILGGNAMQVLAFEYLAATKQLSDIHKLRAIYLLASASGLAGMASGQIMDTRDMDDKIDLDYLEKTHRLKTGSLMASCITIPLACKDDCSASVHRALTAYAEDIGLCFQIQDDILDVLEPCATPTGRQNELNYISVVGIERTRELLTMYCERCLQHLDKLREKAKALRAITHYIATRSS